MINQEFSLSYRFRYLLGGLYVIICLLTLSLLVAFMGSGAAHASTNDSSASLTGADSQDDPNIVADGFAAVSDKVSQATASSVASLDSFNHELKDAASSVANTLGNQSRLVAGSAYSGTAWAVHGVSHSTSFVARMPVSVWHGASNLTHIGDLISPAKANKSQLPQIDPQVAAEIANSKPLLNAAPLANAGSSAPQWPIHGVITEEFGVPHWPYQPIHTGIDISDGAPLGVTPIHPFEPGRVVAVIHSDEGFGNHVIVDHGGGLLSLYGHMNSTAVTVGQMVTDSTILGYEGTTGLSTGVHVHFEIDLNGQPVNPHLYVPGQP